MLWTTRVIKLLQEIVFLLQAVRKILKLRKPGIVSLKISGVFYKGDKKMLRFKLVLPAPGAQDVVSRMLTLAIGGADAEIITLSSTDLETAEFSGQDNDQVTGTLVDIDDADNASEPRDFSFVLVDTLAPPIPGEIGLVVTGED
jgi:hypothetical protein